MDRAELKELHYITPIANLASIRKLGLLSHRRTAALQHKSVAMQEIQDIRATKIVPGGLPLHDYVNLYVNARNPMLFLRQSEFNDLVVLRVSTAVLDLPKVVVTDQNAARTWVRFAAAPEGLSIVDEAYTFAEYWTHDDPLDEYRHKCMMCAEVLVPHVLPSSFIEGAYAHSQEVEERVTLLTSWPTVTSNRKLFFFR